MSQLITIVALLLGAIPAFSDAIGTRFEDHAVTAIHRGRPAPVDITSNSTARQFRTLLKTGAESGPNFAGRFTVVVWGCGTECQSFAVIDARTGRVHDPPTAAELGLDFRLDSRLLVINPAHAIRERYGAAPPAWLSSRFYVFHDDGRWERVESPGRP